MMDKSRRSSYAGMPQIESPVSNGQPHPAGSMSEGHKGGQMCVTEPRNNVMYQRSPDVTPQTRRTSRNPPSRRISRGNEPSSFDLNCSNQSILSAMDRFAKSVSNMDSTVLMPSRLRDMDVSETTPTTRQSDDLHTFFTILNEVKNELIWGSGSPKEFLGSGQEALRSIATPASERRVQHRRQASNGSVASTNSDPDTDSDSACDFSGMDRHSMEHGVHLASAFRHHLHELHTVLHQLADSADYLAARYQEEVEPTTAS